MKRLLFPCAASFALAVLTLIPSRVSSAPAPDAEASSPPPQHAAAPVSPEDIHNQLFDALKDPNSISRLRKFTEFCATLDATTWEAAYDGMAIETMQTGRTHDLEWRLMLGRCGELGGARAMERFFKEGNRFATSFVVTGWAATDPAAARAWVEALPQGADRQTFIGDLVDGMTERNPADAVALLASLPPQDRARYANKLMTGAIQFGGFAAAGAVLDQARAASGADGGLGAAFGHGLFSTLANRMITSNWKSKTPQVDCAWIGEHAVPGDLQPALLKHAASDWAHYDPAAALDWINSLSDRAGPGAAQAAISGVVQQWMIKELSGTGSWLEAHTGHPLHDQVALAYVQELSKTDPAAAAKWVQAIKDPALRPRAQRFGNPPADSADPQ